MKPYNGGKSGSGTYQQIINHIPPHSVYIEAFAGHIGIFRKIRRAAVSVLNDIDKTVCNDIIKSFGQTPADIDLNHDFFQGNLFEKPTKPIVIVRNNDYSFILDRFKENKDAFIYCDPPYPLYLRRSQRKIYNFDWDGEERHRFFLVKCLNCKCAVMISSFPNDIYDAALKGWHTFDFYNTIRSGKKQLERVYMNYPPPPILHDFQYLGTNYRKRQDLKTKVKRHIARLNKLPQHERTALLSAFTQIYKETIDTLIKL